MIYILTYEEIESTDFKWASNCPSEILSKYEELEAERLVQVEKISEFEKQLAIYREKFRQDSQLTPESRRKKLKKYELKLGVRQIKWQYHGRGGFSLCSFNGTEFHWIEPQTLREQVESSN